MEWNVGLDAVDDVLMHGGFGAADCSCAIGGVHDYLRNQWIIMNRDAVTIIQGGFDPNTEAARRMMVSNDARRWQMGLRIFSINATFEGGAVNFDLPMPRREGFARGYLDALLYQVDSSYHLGNTMLDLDTGVHLNEVKLAIRRQEELDGADI